MEEIVEAKQEPLTSRIPDDFIVSLFNQGFHHILEKIVLDFPLKTIQACMKVNPEWSKIVLYFHNSKVSRMLKMQDLKIAEEWRNKNYTIQSKEFASGIISGFNVRCYDIIADQQCIFMNTFISEHPAKCHIIVAFDAKTLDKTSVFTLKEEVFFQGYSTIGLKLDDKYVYFFASQTKTELLIYKRQQDGTINSLPPKEAVNTCYNNRLGSIVAAKIPYVHNGLLYLPIFSSITSCKLIMEIWNIEKDIKITTAEITFPAKDYFLLRDGSGRFFTRSDDVLYFYSGKNGGELQWKKSKPGRQPILLAADHDYAALTWESLDVSQVNDLIEVYALSTGSVLIKFEAEFDIKYRSFSKIAYHRFAISMPKLTNSPSENTYDTITFDLKTRQKIFSMGEDLGFIDVIHFALERDKMFFVDKNQKLHSLKFWL